MAVVSHSLYIYILHIGIVKNTLVSKNVTNFPELQSDIEDSNDNEGGANDVWDCRHPNIFSLFSSKTIAE